MLHLTGRYYRTIPMDQADYVDEPLELDPARTALVVMHCWNIGCEDGPALDVNYFVGVGFPQAAQEADRIMRECIRPAVDAARRAGIAVCHLEAESIAKLHPEAQQDLDPPAVGNAPARPKPVIPGWRKKIVDRSHGQDYPTRSPVARMDRARILQPEPGEVFAWQSGQFDRAMRRKGIENLIYTGFCTDMCILRAPGGIEPMTERGYRVFLMRDATLGCELPDGFDQRVATRWAIGYFETHFGDTVSLADFLKACNGLRQKA